MKDAIVWLAFLALLGAHAHVGAQPQDKLPCAYGDKKCAIKAIRTHVVPKLEFWNEALAKPLGERIGPAPPELIEYLNLDNIANGYPSRPRAAALAPDFLRDVHAAMEELPPQVKRPLAGTFAGLYFSRDLGSTGYNEEILGRDGKPAGGFIVLDPSVLEKQTANAWATWKENTPFKPQPGYTLSAVIEAAEHDNRKNAIRYILLHELGHMFAIGGNIHPSWTVQPKDVGSTAGYPYFRLSWSHSKDRKRYVTVFDDRFPQRKNVVYYFGAKLPAAQMLSTYANLEQTSFASLYAATNPFDDFAEAFVTYVHTVLMQRPLEIRIYEHGKLAKTVGSCWEERRCAEKRKILEQILGTPR